MKINDLINYLEGLFPVSLQESYDNSGFILGNRAAEIKGILISLDITEEVIDEALESDFNLIISHHPLLFSPLKKITGENYTERLVQKAIQHDLNIYSLHTNLDNISTGVNSIICKKIGLKNTRILDPKDNELAKLVTFVPTEHANSVREALFMAGAGKIGEYDSCSYNLSGKGTFRASENTNPFVGKKGEIHFEEETRIETIFPLFLKTKILNALFNAHPYEEVAYDIYPLLNEFNKAGSGMIGDLEEELNEIAFLEKLKFIFNAGVIKYTNLLNKNVKRVAVCGGSGSFLLKKAIHAKADVFLSSDIKYHQFFDADHKILIIDIGHYESEQFTKELIYTILSEKFSNFALRLSKVNTNPINYL
ncbi:Nif3-like dinuclear metal center hexameric protein [Bacteroidota bacterium]